MKYPVPGLAGWILLATLSLAPPGFASPMSHEGAVAVVNLLFNALDCDLDGTVEPAEVDDHFGQLWLPVDRDQSQTLSRGEYAMTHRKMDDAGSDALFADADANRDGEVDVNEYRAHVKRMILLVDSDGDREATRPDVGLKPWPLPGARGFSFAKRPGG